MEEKDLVNTRRVLESYGEETIILMKDILFSNQKNASGELINSLKYTIVYDGSNIDIEFSMIDHGKYVDEGRRPGKMPPISSIRDWCKIKGIQESSAFPIARSIGINGIKPTPFFNSSINSGQDKLIKDLTDAYSKDLESWIQKQIDKKI